MKSFALLCFLLVASACVFVARADDETPAVDAPKMADQPETADVNDEQPEAEEDETAEDEDESEDEEADEEDEEETTDVADDEPEKRGLAPCRRYRKGKLWCRACGCVPICRPRRCARRVCRKVKCTKRVCNTVIRYRIVRYKHYLAYYPGYGPRFVWKTKKVPRKVLVCKIVTNLCTRCRTQSYICGKICKPGPCKRTCNLYGY